MTTKQRVSVECHHTAVHRWTGVISPGTMSRLSVMKAFRHQRSRGDVMQHIQQEPFTSWWVTTWRNVACRCEALWPQEVLSQDDDGVKQSRRVKKKHSVKHSLCVCVCVCVEAHDCYPEQKNRKRKAAAVRERPCRFLGNWEEAFHLRAECWPINRREREAGGAAPLARHP